MQMGREMDCLEGISSQSVSYHSRVLISAFASITNTFVQLRTSGFQHHNLVGIAVLAFTNSTHTAASFFFFVFSSLFLDRLWQVVIESCKIHVARPLVQ